MDGSDSIKVAVGVVKNNRRQILISQRPADKSHGGFWEFPGGKIKPGETAEQALRRELQEELNLTPERFRHLITVQHDYRNYSVSLYVYLVYTWHGDIHGREGQALEWVDLTSLSEYTYPAANNYIISALKLPEFYFITPETEILRKDFLYKCEKILAAGCRMIQFRCKTTPLTETRTVFSDLLQLCNKYSCNLLLNSTVDEAIKAGASGCHLSSLNLEKYKPVSLPEGFLAGASCHNLEELKLAESMHLDFAVLGPVRPTPSHPGSGCLGWEGFADLSARTNLPVYAIGGMKLSDIESAWQNGAQGLASITGIWESIRNKKLKLLQGQQMISV